MFFSCRLFKLAHARKSLLLLGDIPGLFRRGFFGSAGAREDVDCVVVVLGAVILEYRAIHMAQGDDRRPRLRPGGWVIDGELVLDRILIRARKVLRDFQGLRVGILEGGAGAEIGGLDDQRTALPMAARISVPAMDVL